MIKTATPISVLMLVIATASLFAQESNEPLKKNEIGLNLSPFIGLFTQNGNHPAIIGLHYKRNKGNLALRTYGFAGGRTSIYRPLFTTQGGKIEDDQFIYTETVIKSFQYGGRLGAEYRIPAKRISLIIGVDLVGQFDQDRREKTSNAYKIESVLNEGTPHEEIIVSFFESSQTSLTTETIRRQFYGFGGTFGLMIPLHPKWYFMIQTGMDLLLENEHITSKDHINGSTIKSKHFNGWGLSMGSPLAQAAMFIRF